MRWSKQARLPSPLSRNIWKADSGVPDPAEEATALLPVMSQRLLTRFHTVLFASLLNPAENIGEDPLATSPKIWFVFASSLTRENGVSRQRKANRPGEQRPVLEDSNGHSRAPNSRCLCGGVSHRSGPLATLARWDRGVFFPTRCRRMRLGGPLREWDNQ